MFTLNCLKKCLDVAQLIFKIEHNPASLKHRIFSLAPQIHGIKGKARDLFW